MPTPTVPLSMRTPLAVAPKACSKPCQPVQLLATSHAYRGRTLVIHHIIPLKTPYLDIQQAMQPAFHATIAPVDSLFALANPGAIFPATAHWLRPWQAQRTQATTTTIPINKYTRWQGPEYHWQCLILYTQDRATHNSTSHDHSPC